MESPFDIAADLDTPVSAYMKLKPFKPRFLLESVESGERLPLLETLLGNVFVRGAVSGIGGLTALAGLAELAGIFFARRRGEQPAEKTEP